LASPSAKPKNKSLLAAISGPLLFCIAVAAAVFAGFADKKVVAPRLGWLDIAAASRSEAAETPAGVFRLDPEKIRYSQATFSEKGRTADGGEYTVDGNAQWLREHPDQDLPWGQPIRIFRKEPFMDEWGPAAGFGYTGDPKRLVNGEIYTLDHRRLLAYRRAGRKSIPAQWADLNLVRDQRWKFSTPDGGFTMAPHP
jgi:hypothetical protein